MEILIIDDEGENGFSGSFREFLSKRGHSVNIIQDPLNGISRMSALVDLVFIDYEFTHGNNSSLTGADVGMAIRRKYPLAALVMMTAYGEENIRNFIYVGFDDYLAKKIDGSDRLSDNARKLDCLEVARNNAQKRIKSHFTHAELGDTRKRLDCMEAAWKKGGTFRNVEYCAIIAGLLEDIIPKEEKFKGDLEAIYEEFKGDVSMIYSKRKDKRYFYTFNGNEYKIKSNSTYSIFLKVYENKKSSESKVFVACQPALKVRQLLIENPEMWPAIRGKKDGINPHPTIKEFMNDLDIP